MSGYITNDEVRASYDVIVIGGGPAGLAAALAAHGQGASVLILERAQELGGILNQCIHTGFGLHEFKEELTGPEYALRFVQRVEQSGMDLLVKAMVIELTPDRAITAATARGMVYTRGRSVVLAMGCRERTAGAIAIPGERPGGIYTAGMAQKLANEEGYLVGKEILIYGSGDIGLIMARRLTLEGAKVKAVVEIMPASSGLPRNIAQCLDDFEIPLRLSTAIQVIHGEDRVTGVTLVRVDNSRQPIAGTESSIACDTILLSVGLIPENELSIGAGIPLDPITGGPLVDSSLMTRLPGIFAAGNVLQVHDIVDYVSQEARQAGLEAARYALMGRGGSVLIPVIAGTGIRTVVPQAIVKGGESAILSLRSSAVFANARITIRQGDDILLRRQFPILNPAQMVRLEIPANHLNTIEPVRIEVEEANG